MGFIKTEEKAKNQFSIQFLIEKADFDAATTRAFKKRAPKISIPGFRTGKAPRHIIEKMYGKGIFENDALDELLPAAYEAAAKESGLEIVSRPEVDIIANDENGVTIEAVVFVKPEISISDYIGITAERDVLPVTDAEVENEVNSIRERNAREVEITDREAQNGDIANIDFEGFCDGVAFEGGKGEGHDLTLGSGTFIPGFEDQICGKKVGEEFDVNVTFPEDYQATELAGKASVFKCKLNALKSKILPELDDEFAKDISEFNTYAEYLADLKAKITKRHEDRANSEAESAILEALIAKVTDEIPQSMFDAETENELRDYDNNLRMQGLSLNDYVKYTGMTLDQLRAQMAPRAEKNVKLRLALEKIASLENITVSDEETEAEYKRLAETYQVELDQVKNVIDVNDLSLDIKVQKAKDIVVNGAKITDKAPAKKTTRKSTKKTEAPDADAAAEATEEKKPAKKTTRKTTKKTEEAAE